MIKHGFGGLFKVQSMFFHDAAAKKAIKIPNVQPIVRQATGPKKPIGSKHSRTKDAARISQSSSLDLHSARLATLSSSNANESYNDEMEPISIEDICKSFQVT